ncbi:TPA: hypothetical protein ACHV7O_003614 [Klebsiella quasipneumoniae]
MNKLMYTFTATMLSTLPILSYAVDEQHVIPLESNMAASLKPELIGAPDYVTRSLRINYITATEKEITVLVRVGAINTNKPNHESYAPSSEQNQLTKRYIINKYCAPFGDGDIFFDMLRQRNVTIHYSFESGSDVTFLSFSVNKNDCE